MKHSIRNAPSCADDREPGVLGVEQARSRLLQRIQPLQGTERLPLRSALDRVLGNDLISPCDVPGHANSAMDGFALRHADLGDAGISELRCIGGKRQCIHPLTPDPQRRQGPTGILANGALREPARTLLIR